MPTFSVCEEETRDSWGVAVAVAGKQSWQLTGVKSGQVSRRMREWLAVWKVVERLRKSNLNYFRELATVETVSDLILYSVFCSVIIEGRQSFW